MISNLHLIATQSTYFQQLYNEIRLLEGTNQGRPYLDTTGNPSVGIGFNLRGSVLVREQVFLKMGIDPADQGLSAAQQAAELGYLNQLNTAAAGSYASSLAVQTAFDAIMAARAGDALFVGITRITSLTTFTMTDPQMQLVFPTASGEAESKVDAWLAGIPQSEERLALVSLAYNNLIGVNPGGTFKSPALRQAIIDDNRAEAWYEIRYQSNGGQSAGAGIANRRIAESNLFSLYDNSGQGVGEAEAKEVLRMYTIHQPEIQEYESRFAAQFSTGGTDTVVFQIIGAKATLIPIYNAGKAIDGEVLVGNEFGNTLDEYGRLVLDKNDLLFGEGGSDYMYGHGGEDVLYGGAGEDRLYGGAGDDRLEGGAGFDTYHYTTGDGHDRIEDSDADGVIFVNGQMLVGGVKKAGDTDWTSSDGTIKYKMLGTDLVVKLNDQTILTVNENFESGQFGIRLVDGPEIPSYDNGRATQRLYAQTGVEPDGPISVESNLILYGREWSDDLGEGWSWYLWNDQLYGYGGNDFIAAGLGHDRVYGGDGDDRIIGGIYFLSQVPDPWDPSTIDSLDGDDVLDGENGTDDIAGLAGNDRLFGGEGNDILKGDGEPTLGFYSTPPGGDDFLEGGAGDDRLFGDYGKDVLFGGEGNDKLRGDYILHRRAGRGGDEPIGALFGVPFDIARADDDFLDGGAGNDELYGDGGEDTLVGGAGDDQLFGDYTGTYYVDEEGAWTDEAVFDEFGDDVLDGGDGDDLIYGMGSNDDLSGGADVDIMFGGDAADTLFGGEGDDFLYGDNDSAEVLAGAHDFLDGGAGDDQLLGESGNDVLVGGLGNDLLVGDNDLNPQIVGADELFGDEGDDELQGGSGNDLLHGGIGSDAYVLNVGDEQDETFDENVLGDVNTIIFGPGITLEMLTFTPDTTQETLLIQAGADSILVHGFTNNGVNGTGGMQHISVDGLGYSLLDLLGLPSGDIVGTSGNDLIRTGNAGDTVFAGAGNDTITANGGNDQLAGGTGNDTYTFNIGDGLDTIQDTATTGEGNRIVFGAGITAAGLTYTQSPDMLTISYNGTTDAIQLVGFNQNTVLGSLVVSTLEFNDTSVVNLADLYPTFTNHLPTVATPIADQTAPEDAPWTFVVPATTFIDEDAGEVLTYSANLADGSALPSWLSFNPSTRTFTGAPDDAQVGTIGVRITATDPRNAVGSDAFNLTITNVNEAPTVAAPITDQNAMKDEPFSFVVAAGSFADVDPGDTLVYGATLADGSPLPTWLTFNPSTRTFSGTPQLTDVDVLNVRVTATDTGNLSASDVFALTVAHGLNEITGTSANDNLSGTTGNDLIRGLAGNDTLLGQDGHDTLEGGDGNDQLSGGAGSDTLDGGAGEDQLHAGIPGETGSNILRGGAGADRLEGYSGNDTFQGGAGNDTFYDAYGGQNVYLFGRGDGQDTIYSNYGTVRLAADLLPTDVTVRAQTDGALVLSLNDTTDRIALFNWTSTSSTNRVDRVEFANGTVWDVATLEAMMRAGTAGDDYLPGSPANDVLQGLGGNDLIRAYNGDDVLDGGPGNDTLQGNLGGNDTYVFGRGYGADFIQDEGGTADRIQLNAGVLVSDVTLLQNGSNVLLSIDQSHTQMTFAGIEQIVFNDGTTWDAAAMASHTIVGAINSMAGTAGNDTFVVDHTQDGDRGGECGDRFYSKPCFLYIASQCREPDLDGVFQCGWNGELIGQRDHWKQRQQ